MRPFGSVVALVLVSIICAGCNTLASDSASTDPSVSFTDLREIEGLLPGIGVSGTVTGVARYTDHQYHVEVLGRRLGNGRREMTYFNVYRIGGHWRADPYSIRKGKVIIFDHM